MDIRKVEEFKVKQKELIEKKELEEISSINIIKSMERTEELRIKVYEKALIGMHGIALGFGAAAMLLFLYSYTKGFSATYPRAANFFSKSVSIRLLIPLFMLRIGLFVEQSHFESQTNPLAYDDYLQSLKFTQNLMQRRIEKLSWVERIKFGLDIDLQYYLDTINSLINKN